MARMPGACIVRHSLGFCKAKAAGSFRIVNQCPIQFGVVKIRLRSMLAAVEEAAER